MFSVVLETEGEISGIVGIVRLVGVDKCSLGLEPAQAAVILCLLKAYDFQKR